MNLNIELYLNLMENILNKDILKKILTFINIEIINKQKKLKKLLNYEINKYRDIYYKDNKYLIYKNNLNNIAINNINKNKNINYKLIKINNNASHNVINNYIINNSNNLIFENNNINNDIILLENTSNINIQIHVKYI